MINKFAGRTESSYAYGGGNRTSDTVAGTTESNKSYCNEQNDDVISVITAKDSEAEGIDSGKGIKQTDGEDGSLSLNEIGQGATFEQQQQVDDAPQQQTDNK